MKIDPLKGGIAFILFSLTMSLLWFATHGISAEFGTGFAAGGLVGIGIATLGYHSEYSREKRRRRDGGVDYLDDIY